MVKCFCVYCGEEIIGYPKWLVMEWKYYYDHKTGKVCKRDLSFNPKNPDFNCITCLRDRMIERAIKRGILIDSFIKEIINGKILL
jgi:hypothetical protein